MLERHSNGDLTITVPAELADRLTTAYADYAAALHDYSTTRPEGDDRRDLAELMRHRARAQHELACRIGELAGHAGNHVPLVEAFIIASRWYADRSIVNHQDADQLQNGETR